MKISIGVVLCLVIASAVAWGQAITTSQINGTVQEASGLAVPAAEVKATQTETGFVRAVTSGADGSYVLTNLPVGPYRLQVTKEGFSTYVQSGIVLQVNSNPEIKVAMKVGALAEHIEVAASAAVVETQNTGVGQVIDNQRVLDLPLNGRQPQELLLLSGPALSMGSTEGNGHNYPSLGISVAGGYGEISWHNAHLSRQGNGAVE